MTISLVRVEFDLEAFIDGYAECMIWANTYAYDENGEMGESDLYAWQAPGRWALDAFTPAARESIESDCESFASGNDRDLRAAVQAGRPADHLGHDFALTRNGHGAGFWDRGLGDVGDRLTSAAHAYGESNGGYGPNDSAIELD